MSLVDGILLLTLAAICALGGCAFLALSQGRNWRTVMGKGQASGLTRPLGWTLIGVSLVPCIIRDGASFAALLWPLLLAAASVTVALLLAYAPSGLKPIASVLLSK